MSLKSTGYQASGAAVAWSSGQTLNSLVDDEWTDLSNEIDNSSNLYVMMDLYMILASAAFTGADSVLEVYVVPSVDGTNYPKWTGNVTTDEQQNNFYRVGTIGTTGATEAQHEVFTRAVVPAGKFKFGFRSRLNVTTSASGNSVSWRPHSMQDT